MKISLRRSRIALGLGLLLAATAVEAATTVVSLTFGGGRANQLSTLPVLDQYGFKGTYYIITGAMGQPGGYLTAGEVRDIAAAGHEIGSLSVTHADLLTVSHSTMVYEVCQSRQDLLDIGISPVVSFDYPSGHSDETVESVVQSCGYTSGRRSYGLGCPYSGCLVAESIPPADPFFIRTPPVVTSTTALGEIQQFIVDAENSGGGWVPLAFINICDGCSEWSITQADFASLMSWLADRASLGTVVRPVAQVISGSWGLPPPPPPPPPPPSDSNVGLAADLSQARVFPNPWRLDRHTGLGVTIDGLPPRSEVRIFTLSGRWVRTVDVAAGGQGTWGLTDDSGRGVASGIYRYLISAPGVPRKLGSLTVVR
ncbi:MAG: polysaccharide deacetylase family protein [Elusimicrobia bacterium]|nr:polysaccharide deacetylase family protein [Elusimicrobiota bacterium]